MHRVGDSIGRGPTTVVGIRSQFRGFSVDRIARPGADPSRGSQRIGCAPDASPLAPQPTEMPGALPVVRGCMFQPAAEARPTGRLQCAAAVIQSRAETRRHAEEMARPRNLDRTARPASTGVAAARHPAAAARAVAAALPPFVPPPPARLRRWLSAARLWHRPTFSGLENIDPSRPTMFVGNHTLYGVIDVPHIVCELQRVHGIFPRSLGRQRVTSGWGPTAATPIKVSSCVLSKWCMPAMRL